MQFECYNALVATFSHGQRWKSITKCGSPTHNVKTPRNMYCTSCISSRALEEDFWREWTFTINYDVASQPAQSSDVTTCGGHCENGKPNGFQSSCTTCSMTTMKHNPTLEGLCPEIQNHSCAAKTIHSSDACTIAGSASWHALTREKLCGTVDVEGAQCSRNRSEMACARCP
eukprot:PhF_6_TR44179/c0_g1_i2/m.67715